MRTKIITAAVLGAGLMLAGCADNRLQADVTRFHIAPPPARATFAVQPLDPAVGSSLQYQQDAAVVTQRLAALGYVPANPGNAEIIALMNLAVATREGPVKPPPFSIGIGGGSFGRNVGVGGGVSFPVGSARQTLVRQTELFLQMKRRSDQSVVWEGRAATVDPGTGVSLVPQLADALLKDFPGLSGQTVRVTLPKPGAVAQR